MCKMLIRRRIDTARNFANKPVLFACNGVQIRRRVRHKADTKEGGRTARNSRNASRAWKKILQKAARMGGGVPGDRRKTAARGQHPERTTAARHGGKGYRGARLRTVGGYRGGERRQEQEWKTGRHDEAKRFGVTEWCGCSSSRAYIYY